MIAKCQRCQEIEPLPKQRYCKACRKAVVAEAYETGKILPWNVRSSINEARGRKLRSTKLLGGAAENSELRNRSDE